MEIDGAGFPFDMNQMKMSQMERYYWATLRFAITWQQQSEKRLHTLGVALFLLACS